MNTKLTLATLISASLLTLATVPVVLAGESQPAADQATDQTTTAMHDANKPVSDLKQAADSATDAVTDTWIQGKLEASFMADDNLSSFAIDTEVKDGVATLTGTVDSEADRDLATRIAMSVKGVTDVRNSLVVRTAEKISQS